MSAFQMPEAVAEKLADAYLHRRTNADRIRAMTDEELARFLGVSDACPPSGPECEHECYLCWLDWLREEADHD